MVYILAHSKNKFSTSWEKKDSSNNEVVFFTKTRKTIFEKSDYAIEISTGIKQYHPFTDISDTRKTKKAFQTQKILSYERKLLPEKQYIGLKSMCW